MFGRKKSKEVKVAWKPQPGGQVDFLTCPIYECLFESSRGAGKRIADSQKILTKDGWKLVGEVTYKDKLVSIDGEYTDIKGIFHKEQGEMYKFTFDDGAITKADKDHLWTIRDRNWRRDGWKTKSTEWLLNKKGPFFIPLIENPVVGKKWEGYDPYVLGLILGDGSLTGSHVTVCTVDKFIENYLLRTEGWHSYDYESQNTTMCQLTRAKQEREIKDLLDRRIHHIKIIPQTLLESDADTRLALLQGLMDSDGSIDEEGRCTFYSSSIDLAKGLQELVRSLGGKATCRWKKRSEGGFKGSEDGYYVCSVTHGGKFNPFRLPRKANRVKSQIGCEVRRIVSIEKIEDEPATCFTVSHKSHLFVIEDYVVTHNTDALIMDFAQFVGKGYGEAWKGILFRETFPNLQDVIAKTQKWFRLIFPDAIYNSSEHCWKFATGEILYFRHARTLNDYWTFHGHEYPWVGWEELTNWATPDLYLMMMSVCRSSDPGIPRHYRATCNPWGKGHNWVKKRFIDAGMCSSVIKEVITEEEQEEAGMSNISGDRVMERCFVHGDRNENIALTTADPDYELNLARNTNSASKKAWIAGDWDIVAGGMFDDLWDKKIHVIEPFNIPNSWRVYRAFDWGLSKPFSLGWWAVCDGSVAHIKGKKVFFPRGTLIRIGEWYGWEKGNPNVGLRMTDTLFGRGMKQREDRLKRAYGIDKIFMGPADASIFGNESDAESIASKISRAYFGKPTRRQVFSPSNKRPGTRKLRWLLIRDRLEAAVKGDKETPQLFVFNTCQEGFIRTIACLPRDEVDPDDLDSDSEDHALDETAYMVLFATSPSEMRKYTIG